LQSAVSFLLQAVGKDGDHQVPTELGMSRLGEQFAPEVQQVGPRQCRQFTDLAYDVLAHSAPVSHGHSRSDQPASQTKVSGQIEEAHGWVQTSEVRPKRRHKKSSEQGTHGEWRYASSATDRKFIDAFPTIKGPSSMSRCAKLSKTVVPLRKDSNGSVFPVNLF